MNNNRPDYQFVSDDWVWMDYVGVTAILVLTVAALCL